MAWSQTISWINANLLSTTFYRLFIMSIQLLAWAYLQLRHYKNAPFIWISIKSQWPTSFYFERVVTCLTTRFLKSRWAYQPRLPKHWVSLLGSNHDCHHCVNPAEWRIYASVKFTSLVQIMACRLFGTKPLSEPMLDCYWLARWEQTSVKFKSNYEDFCSRKCIWKYRLQIGRHFVSASQIK